MVQVVAPLVAQFLGPAEAVYPMIGEPPTLLGAVQLTDTAVSPG